MSLADRLGVEPSKIEQVASLMTPALLPPDRLFEEAFQTAEKEPEQAQLLLAAAILSQAQQTHEGRLSGALSLLAQLVASANPLKTLGPDGAELRHELMPSGWVITMRSWPRFRYAWREGLESLLDVGPHGQATVQALNEITRLHPSEPDPVPVAIQEQFPAPKVAFVLTLVGLGFTVRTALKEMRQGRRRR
jgi:hypothetical protein